MNRNKQAANSVKFQQENKCLVSTNFNPQASFGIVTHGASYCICCEVIESLGLKEQVCTWYSSTAISTSGEIGIMISLSAKHICGTKVRLPQMLATRSKKGIFI